MKNNIILFLCLISSVVFALEKLDENHIKVSYGNLIHLSNFPSKYISPRNVDIWLPEGYSNKGKYTVLYMHDGQMLFDSTTTWNKQEWGVDEVVSQLIFDSKIKEIIVLGIWNSGIGRHSDYFPQKPFKNLLTEDQKRIESIAHNGVKLFEDSVRSDNYLKFIVEELKPYIDENYSTYSAQQNTFIMGSSMGGLISWYAICEYPQIFSGAACLSTHWPGIFEAKNNPIPQKFFEYLKNNLPDPSTHKFYFDYGTEALDTLYEP